MFFGNLRRSKSCKTNIVGFTQPKTFKRIIEYTQSLSKPNIIRPNSTQQ